MKHTSKVRKIALSISMLFVCYWSHAQLCNGSLGDPVVNITFGAGPNPGKPLNAATTNYQFAPGGCPENGFYTVTNKDPGCIPEWWHILTSDHTGDPNGYFMFVNASWEPSDFYVDTIHGLCGSTTYEFAAWIVNLLKKSNTACGADAIPINITFTIEKLNGAILKTYGTGDIPSIDDIQWKQYGFYFTTQPNLNDVVVRMRNNAQGGCGNDVGIDDITFRPCGPLVFAGIAGNENKTLHLCKSAVDQPVTLTGAFSSGYEDALMQWQQSEDNGKTWTDMQGENKETNTITINKNVKPGLYLYRMSVGEAKNIGSVTCRVVSNIDSIIVGQSPDMGAQANTPLCAGDALTLRANSAVTLSWSGPQDYASTNASATISHVSAANAGKYYVTGSDDNFCFSKDSVLVVVNKASADAGNDTTICYGTTIQLHGTGTGDYSWEPATGLSVGNISNPLFTAGKTTQYILTVTSEGCHASDTVMISVFPKPFISAGADKKILEGDSTMLDGNLGDDTMDFLWTPNHYISTDHALKPIAKPPADMVYTLHAISKDGCAEITDDVLVKVYKKIIVPNAFSPNGDGVHDVWMIDALAGYGNAEISVFNRYGQLVYHSIGYNTPWDGKCSNQPLPVATYYYVIDLKNNSEKLSGSLLILR